MSWCGTWRVAVAVSSESGRGPRARDTHTHTHRGREREKSTWPHTTAVRGVARSHLLIPLPLAHSHRTRTSTISGIRALDCRTCSEQWTGWAAPAHGGRLVSVIDCYGFKIHGSPSNVHGS
ncbi:hypothetical protein J6590_024870 [Homalodisca vitripennis]|nr:hypothetical protein J6590_024870 [Homalodisca vitripennis]